MRRVGYSIEGSACHVSYCSMRADYSVIPMTGTLDGCWEDRHAAGVRDGVVVGIGGRLGPIPACRSHLTSVLTWMGEYESEFHVSTNIATPIEGAT